MTPFGLRKRLKKLLGRAPREEARPRYAVVQVGPDGAEITWQAEEGESLVFASGRDALPIETGCGDSTCATCRCEVLEGAASLSEASDHERATLRANGVPEGMRLGCLAQVRGPGVKIRPAQVVRV